MENKSFSSPTEIQLSSLGERFLARQSEYRAKFGQLNPNLRGLLLFKAVIEQAQEDTKS